MRRRPVREYEKQAREKALEAARLAIDSGLSVIDAAERAGAKDDSTREAVFVLTHGTPEEVSDLRAGKSLRKTHDAIKARLPKSDRARKPTVMGVRQKHIEASDAALYARLRDALDGINSMPRPADVVAICRRQPWRGESMNRRLIDAYSWMVEFSDAWTK